MSEIDVFGRLLRTFTDVHGPRHLSVDSEGRVLVADWCNHRILLLGSELRLQRVLIDVMLPCPTRLCYDELSSRLYVVHRSDLNNNNVLYLQTHAISLFHLR